ncbi:MAG: hypothetical protein V7L01_27475 [Nostoc sp.]|uniref:hypothetical protein n=1 Tax=Nostoc sp. TaxID=1180 RepID=UPI002FF486FE
MNYEELINDISNINNTSLATVVRAVNKILTIRNWLIGACIFEYEQNGVDRAAYGLEKQFDFSSTKKRDF